MLTIGIILLVVWLLGFMLLRKVLGGIAVLVMMVILLIAFKVRWRLLPLLGMAIGIAWGFGAFGFTGDVLTGMIKAHEIQGVIALENSFNRVGLDHVVLVKVASTAVVGKLLGLTRDELVNAVSLVVLARWWSAYPHPRATRRTRSSSSSRPATSARSRARSPR